MDIKERWMHNLVDASYHCSTRSDRRSARSTRKLVGGLGHATAGGTTLPYHSGDVGRQHGGHSCQPASRQPQDGSLMARKVSRTRVASTLAHQTGPGEKGYV